VANPPEEPLGSEESPRIYRPFLVIVPSALLRQWVTEIQGATNRLKISVLYSETKAIKSGTFKNTQIISGPLTSKHELFDGDISRANHIILTTYDTFRSRHGPPAYEKWRRTLGKKAKKNPSLSNMENWPGNLKGLFNDVLLDEGHTVRNHESGLSTAIRWLKAKFHLIISATIFYNSIMDFKGYVGLIVPPDADSVWDNSDALTALGITATTNPFLLTDDHPAAFLKLTHRAMNKYVFTSNVTVTVASVQLRKLLPHLMVRRTLRSSVECNGKHIIIGASIPPSQTQVISVDFSPLEKKKYAEAVAPHYRGLVITKDGKLVLNMAKYRMLTLLTSWLGFEVVESVLTAKHFKEFMRLFLLKTVCRSMAITVYHAEKPDDPKRWFKKVRRGRKRTRPSINSVRTLLRGSPKMRAMLPILAHHWLVRKEKQIVWCNFPANQVFVAAVLKEECGIDAKIFHGKLDNEQREKLFDEFTKTDECPILIMSLAVNALGLNLHPRCNIMHFFDMAVTQAVHDQGVGRLRRFGQKLVVIVYVYSVANSWNTMQAAKANEKSVASMLREI
jgi:SNF2 family DNA or RNA helicase